MTDYETVEIDRETLEKLTWMAGMYLGQAGGSYAVENEPYIQAAEEALGDE